MLLLFGDAEVSGKREVIALHAIQGGQIGNVVCVEHLLVQLTDSLFVAGVV